MQWQCGHQGVYCKNLTCFTEDTWKDFCRRWWAESEEWGVLTLSRLPFCYKHIIQTCNQEQNYGLKQCSLIVVHSFSPFSSHSSSHCDMNSCIKMCKNCQVVKFASVKCSMLQLWFHLSQNPMLWHLNFWPDTFQQCNTGHLKHYSLKYSVNCTHLCTFQWKLVVDTKILKKFKSLKLFSSPEINTNWIS